MAREFEALICWMATQNPRPGAKYYLKNTSREVIAFISEVIYKIDINTMEPFKDDVNIKMNDIIRVKIKTAQPLVFDAYSQSRITGSFILIDDSNNETVAAGTITGSLANPDIER